MMKWALGGLAVLLIITASHHRSSHRSSKKASTLACVKRNMKSAPNAAYGWKRASCQRSRRFHQ